MANAEIETQLSYLVFWPEENAWSLVKISAIEDKDASKGSYAMVKFKGKKYPAIVIEKGATSFLKKEGKKFQDFLNSLLFEEENADDIIKRIREEYLNKTSKAVELLGSSTPVGKVADPGKPNLLAKPANVKKDTPVAKPLNVRNVPPAAKPLNDIQVAHNTTPADKHVSAGSTVAAVVIKSTENVDVSTSSELGACSTMTAGTDKSSTTSESVMDFQPDSHSASVISLDDGDTDDTDVCGPSTKKFRSSKRDFVTKEEMDTVMEDLRSLRRRVRKLEAAAKTKEDKKEADTDLRELIENADNEFGAVEILLLHLFDEDTILKSSVSGKRANTKVSPGAVKKALDFTKIAKIKTVVKSRFPAIKQKDITQKIHSVQKKLQRRSSKQGSD